MLYRCVLVPPSTPEASLPIYASGTIGGRIHTLTKARSIYSTGTHLEPHTHASIHAFPQRLRNGSINALKVLTQFGLEEERIEGRNNNNKKRQYSINTYISRIKISLGAKGEMVVHAQMMF